MDNELNELKKVLRSLVVSSPTQVDVRTLMNDYRSMVGKPIPLAKYGYKEPVEFIKERCSDCFVLQGNASNPVLTLIVPETLKHIDNFVQKQKLSSTLKHKAKRRSIPVVKSSPPRNLICETFIQKQNHTNNAKVIAKANKHCTEIPKEENGIKNLQASEDEICSINSLKINGETTSKLKETNYIQPLDNGICSKSALEKFLKKRIPLYNSSQYLESVTNHNEKAYSKEDTDSGRQTSSSNGSAKWTQLEDLKTEIRNLIEEHAEGVWCTELIPLYREKYGRELNFSRFGYTSVFSLACVLEDNLVIWRPEGSSDWKLLTQSSNAPKQPPAPFPPPALAPLPTIPSWRKSQEAVDPDDALPGIDFEADVFPKDCIHYLESIPHAELPEESTIEVQVGELYSPSHLWLIRLGEDYNIAMEDLMDEMNEYYNCGEGKERSLPRGAVRVGHYCSTSYEGDWHRSLIVDCLDSDTVKVRHVDYGTVERCAVSGLRPLLRRWCRLPQQGLRARLAAVMPPAAGRRWPRSSAAHLLRRLTDKRLIAQIVARSTDAVLEVLLIDTSTDEDVCINTELVRSGHADSRHDSCLGTSECYLYPTFEALECGATPNYAELHSYLRDGIDLEYVEDFRRHVPPCLPSPPTSPDLPNPCFPLNPPTTSKCSLSPHEYPELPLLLTNGMSLFPLGNETALSPPPSRPHTRPTPLFSKPVFTYPNPTNLDSPKQISTKEDPINQENIDPSKFPPIPPSDDPKLTCPQRTTARANDSQSPHGVTLSASDCEVFRLLSHVDANAAHRFMIEAIGRAANPPSDTRLNPEAKEFSMMPAQTQTEPPMHVPTNEPSNNYRAPPPNSIPTQTIHPVHNASPSHPYSAYMAPPVQTHPVHLGPHIPYNRCAIPPVIPTQSKHAYPVYSGLQPNIQFNGYANYPLAQTEHYNPNNITSAPHNGHMTLAVAPAVQRFFENAQTIIPQFPNVRPPPGFEN